MAGEFKSGLFGSSKVESYSDTAISRGKLRWLVTDLDGGTDDAFLLNTDADYDEAIRQVRLQHQGLHFPNDSGLPLEKMTATRFGPYKMWVTADYRYQAGGGFDPVDRMIAAYEPAHESVPVFRRTWRPVYDPGGPDEELAGSYWDWSDMTSRPAPDSDGQAVNNTGLPWGEVMFDASGKPDEQMIQRPVERIHVATTLYFNPFGYPSYVGNYRDTVNDSTVVFGVSQPNQAHPELKGIFSAESLRFDGAWVQQRTDPSGILSVWDTRYQFSLMKGKWYKQVAYHSATLGTLVQNDPMYLAIDFEGKFPVQAAPNSPG